MIALIVVGMFLDGVSTFLILLPVLQPIAASYGSDMMWFGVIHTMKIAIDQFTPPLAVNLMVSCKIAQMPMESTIRWVVWMILAMFGALALVVAFPDIAMWLPRALGYWCQFVVGRPYSGVPKIKRLLTCPMRPAHGGMPVHPAVRNRRPRASMEADLRDRASARSRFHFGYGSSVCPAGATSTPTSPARAIDSAIKPEARASSMNVSTIARRAALPFGTITACSTP